MAKAFHVEMNTSRINAAIAELSRLTGKDVQTVVEAETKTILQKAVTNTPVAQVELINQTKNTQVRNYKLAVRGLLKKAWVQIAEKLNMPLEGVPQYVYRAATLGGEDHPENVTGTKNLTGSKFHIIGSSERVYDNRVIGALSKAFNGRANFFRTNLRKGVFDHMETVQKKYPGLFKVNTNG